MEKKQNVPALRFQGFSGEWEKKTLGDFGNVAMNRRIFKEQTSETGEIPFYKIGTFGKEPDAYISRQLFEEYKAKYPYPDVGDILLSAAGSIGKTVEYTGKDEYFQDSNIVWLKHDERLDNPFLKYFYSKVKWGTLEGGTVKRLYNKILLETEIVLPEIIEQKKIGKFFASYDRMLAHQEGKIRKLQQFRQAMLTKLFPREGAAEPELRFRGFSGKWKSCCLTDIATINPPGELPETFNYVDLESVIGTEIVKYRRETKFSAPSRAQRVAEDNDVFYQMVRPYQKNNCIFRGNDKTFVFSTGYAQLRPNCNSYFLLSLLQTEYFVGKVMELCTGTSFPAISASDLARIPIYVPVMSEENGAIGEYFQNLDSYISLQQKKLERMQRLKAALLEKLFV